MMILILSPFLAFAYPEGKYAPRRPWAGRAGRATAGNGIPIDRDSSGKLHRYRY
jgi:hypothetical protein